MRIAVVGKGGSGKTTVSSLLFHALKEQGTKLLAIDADINQHLAEAVGLSNDDIPELGNNLTPLKRILMGTNKLIPSPEAMVKTTLPGEGSHLIKLNEADEVLKQYAHHENNTWFMRVGGFEEADIGTKCFHAKTGSAELILNHLIDDKNEAVLMDMTAGADAFASGLFTRFDLTIIVVEPTLKSLQVYKQYKNYAQDYALNLCVVGNKVQDKEDIQFLKENCGNDLLTTLSFSPWVKAQERGNKRSFEEIEENTKKSLQYILNHAQKFDRDWKAYWKQGLHFHNSNAISWANASLGQDVRTFISPKHLEKISP